MGCTVKVLPHRKNEVDQSDTSLKTGEKESKYFLINKEEGQQAALHKQRRVTAGTSS